VVHIQVAGVWNAKDELPIEIDLPQECRYHSVFACPILRQQVPQLSLLSLPIRTIFIYPELDPTVQNDRFRFQILISVKV
jgi:hypothetical protein